MSLIPQFNRELKTVYLTAYKNSDLYFKKYLAKSITCGRNSIIPQLI